MRTRARVTTMIFAALAAIGVLAACSSAPAVVTDVTAADAVTILGQPGITVVDVRTAAEYSAGHLADAVNIDIEGADFDAQLTNLPKEDAYFVYCHSGNRSGAATEKMEELGFTKVYNLKGGITDWQSSGGAVVTS